tara:strand:- start:1278 stop:1616 length:339 start_codon:yes stop_codon:yes gene_type:complete
MVATEKSEIKNKAKLKEYLYKNPTKLACKLAQLIKDDNGNLLQLIKLKGSGMTYCYSINDKKFILTPRSSEYYLLPWASEDPRKCFIYCHSQWQVGVIFRVFKDDIDFLGFN